MMVKEVTTVVQPRLGAEIHSDRVSIIMSSHQTRKRRMDVEVRNQWEFAAMQCCQEFLSFSFLYIYRQFPLYSKGIKLSLHIYIFPSTLCSVAI